MSVVVIQAERVAAQPWRNGGGQTRELLAWPNASDWKLRISRAEIASDGPFSAFAGVQRWFVVISGKGVVLHMPMADGRTQDLQLLPGHTPLHFEGNLAPGCSLIDGATQDLNLMARDGTACMHAVEMGHPWLGDFTMRGLYTACSGVWSDGVDWVVLPANCLLWIADASATSKAAFRFTAHDTEPARAWWLGYTPDPT
jgi:environmental stress-induced protein Ves